MHNSYHNASHSQTRDRHRGESSKSRASMRSNHPTNSLHENSSTINQIGPVSQIGQMMGGTNMSMGHGSDMRKQQNVYSSKYNLKDNIKSTPGAMISSKIGMKQHQKYENLSTSSQSNAHQPYPGNLQQPNPKYQNVHSSQVGKKSGQN